MPTNLLGIFFYRKLSRSSCFDNFDVDCSECVYDTSNLQHIIGSKIVLIFFYDYSIGYLKCAIFPFQLTISICFTRA